MRALRICMTQSSANYRREETVDNKMTYPLPPYSTVIGAIHKACGYTDYHDMKISIQGKYGGMRKEVYLDHCYLNSLQNDRGLLVKACNETLMSNGYVTVAKAKKGQGNDFRKGITIDVLNQEYLDEYRRLKDLNDEISEFKKVKFQPLLDMIKSRRKHLSEMKNDASLSEERRKAICDRENELKQTEKDIKQRLKAYEYENYQKPISFFKTLTTAPKYYEVLYDVELIIHVVAADDVMECIYDNIDNLTSVGRSEDFVCVEECEFTELEEIDDEYNCKYYAYIPADVFNDEGIDFRRKSDIPAKGTRYLINKDYKLSNDGKRRIFNRKLVVYMSDFTVFEPIKNVFVDKGEKNYVVSLV